MRIGSGSVRVCRYSCGRRVGRDRNALDGSGRWVDRVDGVYRDDVGMMMMEVAVARWLATM